MKVVKKAAYLCTNILVFNFCCACWVVVKLLNKQSKKKNCGEFVEINSDLLATYLFNNLSKTFTNVLQITKFYKNHKKLLYAKAMQTAGCMQIFFLLFTDFQWKNCRSADV